MEMAVQDDTRRTDLVYQPATTGTRKIDTALRFVPAVNVVIIFISSNINNITQG